MNSLGRGKGISVEYADPNVAIDTKNTSTSTTLDSKITGTETATLAKTVITGQDATGAYYNAYVDKDGHQAVHIEDPISAFGDIEVVNKTPRLAEMFTYNLNTRKFTIDDTNNITGAVDVYRSMARCKVVVGEASAIADLQSKDRIRYRPGQGITLRYTFMWEGLPLVTALPDSYIGFIDNNNGVAIGYQGNATKELSLLHRNSATGSVVDTWTPQSSWDDPLDGTGSSGITLNIQRLNIIQIQWGYLGTAAFKYSIMNPGTGRFEVFYIQKFPNTRTSPTFGNPSLPFRIRNANGSTTQGSTAILSASYAGFVDGEVDRVGALPNASSHEQTSITTENNVLSVRCDSTYQSKTQTNLILPKKVSIATIGGNRPILIRILKNPTISGVTWVAVNTSTSIASTSTTQGTITGGELVNAFVMYQDTSQTLDLSGLNIFLSPGEWLTVSAQTSGTGIDAFATISWLEDI